MEPDRRVQPGQGGDCLMFEPNWASPPGDTISRIAAAEKISVYDLAGRIGLEEDVFFGVMEGRIAISEEIASLLSAELGASPKFWMERYKQFIADKARIRNAVPVDSVFSWQKSFPVNALRKVTR